MIKIKNLTPLEELRAEKRILKDSCKKQEARMQKTFEFLEDNIVPLTLKTAAGAFSPASLIGGSFAQPSGSTQKSGFISGLMPKGLLAFAARTALGLLIGKKAGSSKNSPTGNAATSIATKIAGKAFPIAIPVATIAWKLTKPYITSYAKKKALSLFKRKKK
ncbi:MAG: hypothetical protein QM654_08430 [Dysgonamonadaceae bacterium]